jgi:MoaA/NifB/PqqE/SkfB family radical SAM enzyme
MSENNYVVKFDRNLSRFFRTAFLGSGGGLASTAFLLRTMLQQRRAVSVRARWTKKDIQVPPLLIASITNRCNLQCKGCYAHAIHTTTEAEMSDTRLMEVVREADELGISIIMIAGGEPLLRPVFFELARLYPHILFPVFTNGLLIDETNLAQFEKLRNLVPILSLEGQQAETDLRRGSGVFETVNKKMRLLRKAGILFGTSLTLTRLNFDLITSVDFQNSLSQHGSQVSIFVDYVPVQAGTEALTLTPEQKAREAQWMRSLRERLPGLFVSLPGDEEQYGGCLAAGRGFVHINPSGHLEPCPFAPFSDADLTKMSLKQALGSDFLRILRENADKLEESQGGCTLWENRAWVVEQIKASRTKAS